MAEHDRRDQTTELEKRAPRPQVAGLEARVESPLIDTATVREAKSAKPRRRAPGAKLAPGEVFAERFLVIDLLGSGGFGSVYRAKDLRLGRELALKILHIEDGALREMLLAEARTAIKLEHANIVQVFDAGEHDGKPWLAMALVAGRPLQAVIEDEGALPLPRVLRIVDQAAAALDHAHRVGFVHRDVKPANMLLQDGDHLVVLDFGIAAARRDPGVAAAGLAGTPGFIAPELVAGAPPGPKSDQFALGATIYEMLTGLPAFKGSSMHGLLRAVSGPAPQQPHELRKDVPREVSRALSRALAKDPTARYGDCRALAADLRRAARSRRRRRALVLAGAAAGVMATLFGWHAWSARLPELSFRVVAETKVADGTRSVAELVPGATLHADDRFFLDDVAASRDGYLSVFLFDSSGKFQPIVPAPGAPPLAVRAGQAVRLPKGAPWELDEHAGTETLFVVATLRATSASDLDRIVQGAREVGTALATTSLTRGLKGHDANVAVREVRAKAIEELLNATMGRTRQVEIVHE